MSVLPMLLGKTRVRIYHGFGGTRIKIGRGVHEVRREAVVRAASP